MGLIIKMAVNNTESLNFDTASLERKGNYAAHIVMTSYEYDEFGSTPNSMNNGI